MTEFRVDYWKRISVEATAIVASILLAFAIDAWWDDRRDRIHEQSYLVSLRQEIAESLELAAQGIDRRERAISAHVQLVAQVQGAARATDSELYELISYVSLPIGYIPPRSVFNDIVASGGTVLIRSDELRFALAEFEQGLQYLERIDASSWKVWEDRLQPLLEGKIPRVERLRLGLRRSVSNDVPFGESPHSPDFEGVFADPRFEDMLAERWLRLRNGLNSLKRLTASGEEIVRLIELELEPG